MRTIAIEGLDGSGKTTVAHALATSFEAEGQLARVISPYRQVNEEYGTEIYPLWKSDLGATSVIGLIKTVLSEETLKAQDEKVDVLIFDRHWMTAFTEIAARPNLVREWGETFVPTAYLTVNSDTARKRASNDKSAVWMNRHNYDNYAIRYKNLCREFGGYLLGIYRNDDDVSVDSIVRSIRWDMNIRR